MFDLFLSKLFLLELLMNNYYGKMQNLFITVMYCLYYSPRTQSDFSVFIRLRVIMLT